MSSKPLRLPWDQSILKLSTPKKPNQQAELEIRVAQELKNHRDFIYETNQTLQKLEFDNHRLVEELARTKSQVLSDVKRLYIEFENFQQAQNSKYENMHSEISEALKTVSQAENIVTEMSDKYQKVLNAIHGMAIDQECNFRAYDLLEGRLDRIQSQQDNYVRVIRGEIDHKVERAKSEIDFPKENPWVQQSKSDFANLRKDVDCFKTDMNRLTKALNYAEKKIEAALNRTNRAEKI